MKCVWCNHPGARHKCGGPSCSSPPVYCGIECQAAHWPEHHLDCIGVGEGGKRAREEDGLPDQVIVETMDGQHIAFDRTAAARSITLRNLMEDAGVDVPIPLLTIHSSVVPYFYYYLQNQNIDHPMFAELTYPMLMQLLMAVNYLDIDGHALMTQLTEKFRFNRRRENDAYLFEEIVYEERGWSRVAVFETYANNGFSEEERALIQASPNASLLGGIRNVTFVPPPANNMDYRMIHLDNDILRSFIFPDQMTRGTGLQMSSMPYMALMLFRQRHIRFWHVTTRYILNWHTKAYPFLKDLDEETCFELIHRRHTSPIGAMSDVNISKEHVLKYLPGTVVDGATKRYDPMVVLYVAYRKYGSIANVYQKLEQRTLARKTADAEKQRARAAAHQEAVRVKEANQREAARRQEIRDQNDMALQDYIISRDLNVPRGLVRPLVDDHVIVNFDTDPVVQPFLQVLRESTVRLNQAGSKDAISKHNNKALIDYYKSKGYYDIEPFSSTFPWEDTHVMDDLDHDPAVQAYLQRLRDTARNRFLAQPVDLEAVARTVSHKVFVELLQESSARLERHNKYVQHAVDTLRTQHGYIISHKTIYTKIPIQNTLPAYVDAVLAWAKKEYTFARHNTRLQMFTTREKFQQLMDESLAEMRARQQQLLAASDGLKRLGILMSPSDIDNNRGIDGTSADELIQDATAYITDPRQPIDIVRDYTTFEKFMEIFNSRK
jgi:hypothetical protein